jgi:hypothetical protein
MTEQKNAITMTPRSQGILLMLAAMAVFTPLDGIAKFVLQYLPMPAAVLMRYSCRSPSSPASAAPAPCDATPVFANRP